MPTMEQQLEQQITDHDIAIIEQGQMLTDLELKILEIGGTI